MISIKEMEDKLDGFRSAHGYLFTIVIQDDGTVILDTGLKVRDISNLTKETELVCQYECGDHCL